MSQPRAIGYLRRDVSGIQQTWDETQIRSLAARFGYNLTKTVVFSEHTDRPVLRLCTVVARLAVDAVFTPNAAHFDGAAIPKALTKVADVVTVNDEATYARAVAG